MGYVLSLLWFILNVDLQMNVSANALT